MEEIDPHKCIARMWNKGCGGQCAQKRKFGDFCKKHKGYYPYQNQHSQQSVT